MQDAYDNWDDRHKEYVKLKERLSAKRKELDNINEQLHNIHSI